MGLCSHGRNEFSSCPRSHCIQFHLLFNTMALQGLHCWSFLSHDLSSVYFLSTCPMYLNQKVLSLFSYFLTEASANDLGTERSPQCKRRGIGHLSSSPASTILPGEFSTSRWSWTQLSQSFSHRYFRPSLYRCASCC